jgi:hypothetical protein
MTRPHSSSFWRRPESSAFAGRRWIPAFAGMTLSMVCAAAQAQPVFALMYKQQFGYAPSCNACHKDGGGTAMNAYGDAFKSAGKSLAAFAAIARQDADGDGIANGDEAVAKANPGFKGSTPKAPGDWLDALSLIPKEVQARFPGVKTWLPKDALLTDADVARAQALGASLSKADDNTIYIPLADQRPSGTALIFAAEHRGKPFYLLLITDRQLNVTSVEPMNTRQVPEAAKSAVYASFKGLAVDKLPAARGSDLEAVITAAVKKAGTLLYVRLKSA